jgi:hypothetical protein
MMFGGVEEREIRAKRYSLQVNHKTIISIVLDGTFLSHFVLIILFITFFICARAQFFIDNTLKYNIFLHYFIHYTIS